MRRVDPAIAVLALAGGLAALVGALGGDLRWAVALGDAIVRTGHIPNGIPFSSAATHGWPNVPVLGEVVLGRVYAVAGERGLLVLQVAAVVAALEVLRRTMRARGASPGGAAAALALLFVGAFPSFVVVRLQLFSLVPFAVLVAVLAAPRPSTRALRALPVLFLVWSNLHGGVLVGLAVLATFALFRLRTDRLPLVVCAASALAACVTPALWRTPAYYYGVATSVAARRHVELWAPLSPTRGFDAILAVCALALAVAAFRGARGRWELVAVCVLGAATIHTARTGVWLLMFASVPAAAGLPRLAPLRARLRPSAQFGLAAAGAMLALVGLVRGPSSFAATTPLVAQARTLAAGTPILADGVLGEQLALSGARIWVGEPLDAFPAADQRLYLDWSDGAPQGDRALAYAPRVVLSLRRSASAKRLARDGGFRLCARDARALLFVRRGVAC